MQNMRTAIYIEVGLLPVLLSEHAGDIPSGGLSKTFSGRSAWLAYFTIFVRNVSSVVKLQPCMKEETDFDHSSEDLCRVRLS